MKKPAAKAKSAADPSVEKTPVSRQAASAAPKVSASAAKTAKTAKASQATATGTSAAAHEAVASTQPAGRKAAPSATPLPMKKTAAASSPATSTPSASIAAPATRGGRVSRLSQLTVPSMAQSVASTAAKSSFTQIASTALVPPPHVALKKDPKLANNWKDKTVDELTDAEVIAMPDAEYMNDKQMAFFRLKLVALKKGILDNAGETTEHLREDTVVVPDPADRATIEEEHALELRTRDRERKLLKKIEQSIQRIDAGDYGYCDETGEPIGVGRLLARPTATLSLEAQQRRELKQKMFGD
ncbi:RNA polymerase-binding protein DksA [Variovorax ginsengisoli]|uniref:RNA polymerase-binding transcription factor DksA n=1 Tax=Variovorax ginsengisoli TaxID=363844 RepID=A0ABT9SBF6_9BURK|nr:RNA polymerase-binding protein DksA [Variovorax ginsengisoli]MDP9901686.1 DnaK suppressor protein [Variovorax ginsengisoli]